MLTTTASLPGLYLHIPFCSHRCGYCDFATWEGRDHMQQRYVAALRAEAEMARRDGWTGPFRTVFLGGGTPTRLSQQLFGEVMALVQGMAGDAVEEGTLEANPESLADWHLAGLPQNWRRRRVSLGVQDLTEAGRVFLERQHSREDVERCVRLVREHSDLAPAIELNLDLIVGWPGQTPQLLAESLGRALDLAPDHLSVYLLTIEPGTPFASRIASGALPEPDADFQADCFQQVHEVLECAGYVAYEISNFAREPRFESQHNRLYWEGGEYLGLGVSAASHRAGQRWSNVRSLEQYVRQVSLGTVPRGFEEQLGPWQRQVERLWLGLRLREGVPEGLLSGGLECAVPLLERFAAQGWLLHEGGRWRLTRQGMLLSNEVFGEVLDLPEPAQQQVEDEE